MSLPLALVLVATSTPTPDVPRIEVLTFGRGEDPFSHFGHAAVCIRDRATPEGRCLNYGTADFSTPVPLTLSFLRGEASFWVSEVDRPRTVAWYQRENRSIERQDLPLAPEEATALRAALEASSAPDVRYYKYHHFRDNCTTRIRDLIDNATGGRLAAATKDAPSGHRFRDYVEDGFGDQLALLALSHVMVGRAVDRPASEWEAMFLPSAFRDGLTKVYGATPADEFVSGRKSEPHPRWSGHALILGLGLISALLARKKRAPALLVPSILGLLILAVSIYSVQDELHINEALLVLWPTDVLFARRRNYLKARIVWLAVIAVLLLAGVLVQPLGSAVIALLGVMLSRLQKLGTQEPPMQRLVGQQSRSD